MLAVAAYAKAKAGPFDPLSYAAYHPLANHHPLVFAAPDGCRDNDGALFPCASGVLPALAPLSVPAAEAESVGKREAEADPEADPWYAYYAAHPYAYAGYGGYYAPHAYSYAPYTYSHVYSHYGLPHHFGYYGKVRLRGSKGGDI